MSVNYIGSICDWSLSDPTQSNQTHFTVHGNFQKNITASHLLCSSYELLESCIWNLLELSSIGPYAGVDTPLSTCRSWGVLSWHNPLGSPLMPLAIHIPLQQRIFILGLLSLTAQRAARETCILPIGVSIFRPKFYGNGVILCQNVDTVR